ncbi:MAG: class II fumarate hydratase [Phycisphaerae bacterium]
MKTRTETDSMGPMEVPADALYGASTARAVENFPISGWTMPREFIAALGAIKLACAEVNKKAKRLPADIADAIVAAAKEVMDGKLDEHFPVDVFQTGSGTSTNTNANEVIANRANQLLAERGNTHRAHPNDHVNMCQSSNDVIPATIHVAAYIAIRDFLKPPFGILVQELDSHSREFDAVVKIGRTHLMDAVPIRLGQEFAGYTAQAKWVSDRVTDAILLLWELPIGGTAVGTGLNAPKDFGQEVCHRLTVHIPGQWREADNHFAAQAAKDAVVYTSGVLRTAAIALGKIASDIRLMGSGPRCGIGELILPATQPGSSMMPGKVNPVICESVIQVACQVVGCDAAITAGATGGVGSILELNVAMPMIAWNLLTSIRLLANAARVLEEKCIRGLKANEARCKELVEQSLAMITVLAPRIGYDVAAAIAKEAHATGKTIREICLEKKLLPAKELASLLDPRKQTGK